MRDKIISLCIFVLSPKNNYHWLLRIADWKDGVFLPKPYDPNNPEEGSNFEWLFFPESKSVGLKDNSVGMFEWEYYQIETTGKWRQDPTARPDITWTEVLRIGSDDAEKLCQELRNGTKAVDGTHDILYVVGENGGAFECLHWRRQDMRPVRSGYALTESCKRLDRCLLPKSCVVPFCARTVAESQMERYYCTDMGSAQYTGYFATLPRNEILHQIVKDSLEVYPQGRSKRVAVKQVFAHLEEFEVEQKFAEEAGITVEEAKEYILHAVQRGEQILDIDQGDDRLYQMLIENDAALVTRLRELVKVQWKRDHHEQVEQAQQEWESLNYSIEALREEERACQNSISGHAVSIKKLEEKLASHHRLEQELQSKFRQQIDAYQNDLSQLLCEVGLLNPPQGPHGQPQSPSPLYMQTPVSKELLMDLGCEQDVIDELIYNLEQAGVADRDDAELLSQYLLAAYHGRDDLLLVGTGGGAVADALCAVLFGKCAAVLTLSDTLGPEQIRAVIETTEEQIIYIEGMFSGRAPDTMLPLLQRYPDKQFLIGVPFADELRIEPKGLYSYALPLDCDYFVRSKATQMFGYGKGIDLLNVWKVTEGKIACTNRFLEDVNKIFPIMPRQKEMASQILARIPGGGDQGTAQVLSSDVKRIGILACVLPLVRCCGEKELYQTILKTGDLLKVQQQNRASGYIESVM